MKLSEQRLNAALYRIECGMNQHKDDATCVAMAYRQLEEELAATRIQLGMALTERPVVIMKYDQLEEEEEALKQELIDERKNALEAMHCADWITDEQYIEATALLTDLTPSDTPASDS